MAYRRGLVRRRVFARRGEAEEEEQEECYQPTLAGGELEGGVRVSKCISLSVIHL